MKWMLVGIFSGLVSTAAFAGCEDGSSMAQEAVMKDLVGRVPRAGQCRVKVGPATALPDGEKYSPVANCRGRVFLYGVSLQELEDAQCRVRQVVRVGTSG